MFRGGCEKEDLCLYSGMFVFNYAHEDPALLVRVGE
jgi:hypothetical protein